MPAHNSEIAAIFDHLADLLEIEGANPFRVRAYRNAARTVENLGRDLSEMVAKGEDLTRLPTIGEDLADKIAEIVRTGRLSLLDEVKKRTPAGLSELTALPGLGPKRAKALYEQLHVRSLADLKKAAEAGKVAKLAGFGEKAQAKLLSEIARRRDVTKRFRRAVAEEFAEPLLAYLRRLHGAKQAVIAGSYRRRQETVGDIDILVTARNGSGVIQHFISYDEVDQVVSQGSTRSTVVLRSGLQVDLRVVPEVSYGAALHYFTGSKAHNIAVRKLGIERGLKINEYGVFKEDRRIAGRSEEEVYAEVDLPYIEPELRENRGEIEAARAGKLPRLIRLEDIRGDLHSHTVASDGKANLFDMAEAARARGYQYLAITDHSHNARIAHGLDAKRLGRQLDEIDKLNETLQGITLLKSSEVDILDDGSLDFPDEVLARLDFTVCSIHSNFGLSEDAQTERVLRAMDNRHFTILGHPTGRLIGERAAYPIDLERIMRGAKERGCFIEINAHPMRLDLDDVHCRMAKEMGLKLAISTDAHSTDGLAMMRFGVDQARRGWIERDDVLNTRGWTELKGFLKRS